MRLKLASPLWLAALVCASALGVATAAAQEPSVTVDVNPRQVAANGQVQVQIRVSGPDAGSATLDPAPPGGKLIPGSGISTSSSFQVVNGQMSASKTFTLTYLPSGTGNGQVPAFTVNVAGRKLRTSPVPVSITAAPAAPPPSATPQSAAGDGMQILVLTDVSRGRIYVGESITMRYRLLFRQRVTGILSPQVLETVPNFLVEDAKVSRDVRQVQHEGQAWNEAILFERKLSPTRSGKLAIAAVEFSLQAEDQRARRSLFDFGRRLAVNRTARGVTIDVRPLPQEGRPSDFSGAVGRFTLKAELDRTDLDAGDAAALTVTIDGDGPLDSATPPAVPEVADIRIFDPDVGIGRRGRRTWTYPLVPQTAGAITLPEIRWSYFDPRAERYRTLASDPLTLNVAGSAVEGAGPVAAAGRRIQALAKDLRFIKPAPRVLANRLDDYYRQGWYWMLVALPIVAIPTVMLAGRYRERLDRSGATRVRGAARHARRRLKEALGALDRGDATEAQRLAAVALANYVADRSRRAAQGMTHDELTALAARGGASNDTTAVLRRVTEGFDGLRYTPGDASADETRRLIGESEQVVERLEKEWR